VTVGRDKADGADEVDLSPEQRARITDVYGRLRGIRPEQLLGVPPGADRKALRAAYHRMLSEFHSDRFFRKRLGSYRAMMDAIVARVTAAYESLYPNAARSPDARTAPTPPQGRPAGEERDRAMTDLKRLYEERVAEARRRAERAQRASAQGDVVGAVEAYREAARLAPGDAKLKEALAKAEAAAFAKSVEARVRQAEFEERYGHWEEAARSWKRVLEADPGNARAREREAAARARVRKP
jgi:tetratricopeptide (TPR) repeat protein